MILLLGCERCIAVFPEHAVMLNPALNFVAVDIKDVIKMMVFLQSVSKYYFMKGQTDLLLMIFSENKIEENAATVVSSHVKWALNKEPRQKYCQHSSK